jgi:Ca2+-transporting ATPase
MTAEEVTRRLEVDPETGLSSAEAARRQQRYGPNRLVQATREPRWRVFARQFQSPMILILLAAAVASAAVAREWETPAAIAVVVLLNGVIGFIQESRAESALEALRQMTITTATVRRDAGIVRLDAEELVPGDVVVLEAGDRVPADGRLLSTASLEAQESSLTGEAHSVPKSAAEHVRPDAELGDRVTAVFMNTGLTRGRGQAVVTTTGMATETGKIARMLSATERAPTPLQRQIDSLSKTLAAIAGVVIVVVIVLGLLRGQPFESLFVGAVSLAVAAIPEGLPAVVAFTLAMGAGRLAKQGAIVKRLASVETLGSTQHICTDKTGTLTLNQMTARELLVAGRRFTVSGEGYALDGRIRTVDGSPLPATLDQALLPHRRRPAAAGAAQGAGDPVRLRLQVHGHVPPLAGRPWIRRRQVLRQGCPRRAGRTGGPVPRRRADPDLRRRRPPAVRGGQREPRRARHAGHGGRGGGLPGRRLRSHGRPQGHARPDRAGGSRRDRGPAPAGGPAVHRRMPARRYPGPDAHR